MRIVFSEDIKTYVPRTHQIQELDLVRIREERNLKDIRPVYREFMADSDNTLRLITMR